MAKLNVPRPPVRTHQGGIARHISPEQQLRRAVMACLLWEKTFYESGIEIANRIEQLITKINPVIVANIAKEARNEMHIRHAPLLIARIMAKLDRYKFLVSGLLENIIQRPDELTEFIAIYCKDGKQPLSAQVKRGLAKALMKFDEYQLSKYNNPDADIKLKYILQLCHPKPMNMAMSSLWKRLKNNRLKPADTWEKAISACGKNTYARRREWIRLINTRKIGGSAMLQNLRNMHKDGVDESVIINGIRNINAKNIFPYKYITAAQYAPYLESYLEEAMFRRLSNYRKLRGHTVLLIDVSYSMEDPLSYRTDKKTEKKVPSETKRYDAACGLAMLLREICDRVDIFTFSKKLIRIAPRRGFALKDAILTSQVHSGTLLGGAVKAIYSNVPVAVPVKTKYSIYPRSFRREYTYTLEGFNLRPDRLIVITDEQSADKVPDPKGLGYVINIGTNKNGVGYGKWLHIDGFSEMIINYISEYESQDFY